MPYCAVIDVRTRIPEMTPDIVDDLIISDFIIEATSYIDDAFRKIYDVPFTTVPTTIKSLTVRYAAYLTLQMYPDRNVEEDLERMKIDIIYDIQRYTSGKFSLGSDYQLANPVSEPYHYTTTKYKYDYFKLDRE